MMEQLHFTDTEEGRGLAFPLDGEPFAKVIADIYREGGRVRIVR